jgi:phosphatidylserine/phosphatidylglycerophosphate/cardiolipin synthase-like enzyme
VNNYKSYTGSLFLASFLIIAFLSILKRYTAGLIGSSNLTPSGLIANTELNVIMTPGKDLQYLEHWFDDLWEKESEDFEKLKITEVIASAIEFKVSQTHSRNICLCQQ